MNNDEFTTVGLRDDQDAPIRPIPWWQLMIRYFPRRNFVVGGLIPIVIYAIFQRREQLVTGALLSGSWALAVVLVDWWRTRRIEGFAILAVIFSALQLFTTLITRSATFYVLTGVIGGILEAMVYFGSLGLRRPLIQIAAEATGATATIPNDLRRSPAYRRAWQILTAIWGATYLGKALGLALVQRWCSQEAALTYSILMGWPFHIVLLAFTFWFPGWYWSRQPHRVDGIT